LDGLIELSQKFIIYPNPVQSEFEMVFNSTSDEQGLFEILMLQVKKLNPYHTSYTRYKFGKIHTSKLKSGMYIINLSTNAQSTEQSL